MTTEITAPVELVDSRGRLNPQSVGWTRTPLHDTSGIGAKRRGGPLPDAWGRNKRWEYWLITTPEHLVSLTISDVDYAASHSVWVYEIATGRRLDVGAIVPFARGAVLPGSLGDGSSIGTSATPSGRPLSPGPGRMGARVDDVSSGTRLRGYGQAAKDSAPITDLRFDVVAHRPEGHESLGVVVPWSDTRFQYTVKDTARPASGWIEIDGERIELPQGESWAILDHGRGRWPYSMEWNWGAASGWAEIPGRGRTAVGLQFGGKWTDGTGSRENALTVGDRLFPLHEDITWDYTAGEWLEPWRLRSDSVDLVLEPFWDHDAITDLGVLAMKAHQVFGYYSGTVRADGQDIPIDRMLGFAEDVRNKW